MIGVKNGALAFQFHLHSQCVSIIYVHTWLCKRSWTHFLPCVDMPELTVRLVGWPIDL